ncbi:MAG: hypothetical protein A3J75_00105 [Acidobacteria bacterium RBG_16_68_9]|nr:MAG: hypothetical protein A3J75_00105 [Acidobacteria bacterium RBG_16_68_9]
MRLADMTLSPRYLVVVNLVLLALAAYSASGIVGTTIVAKLMPPLDVELNPPPPVIVPEQPKPASYYALIHERDIFNSAKPAEPPPAAEPPKKTQLKLKLWGVAIRGVDNSYCIIEDQSTRKQELFRVNDMVAGVATVKSVQWDKVILTRDGADEILDLVPDTTGRFGPAAAGIVSPMTARAAVAAAGTSTAGGIHMISENEYQIDRGEVDRAFENLSQLFTQMRAVPHFEGGKTVGFRLFAIRRGSLFDRIGLRNGDVIKRINSVEMNDPSRALAMLDEFRNERDLTVQLLRNRQAQTVRYQVR